MYLIWSYLLSVFLWRRVIIRTKSGNRLVFRRPKTKSRRQYADDLKLHMVSARGEPLRFGNTGRQPVSLLHARDIDTVEVY